MEREIILEMMKLLETSGNGISAYDMLAGERNFQTLENILINVKSLNAKYDKPKP